MIRPALALLAGAALLLSCVDSTIPPPEPLSSTCPLGPLPAGAEAEIPNDGSHDPALLSAAVTAHVTQVRCDAGLGPVQDDARLLAVAATHSDDMAALDFFGHRSPVPGRAMLGDRLAEAAVPFRDARENLKTGFFVAYEAGVEYRTVNAANCVYTYGGGSGFLPRHSYTSMARELVGDWMRSEGHRANLLAPQMTRVGTAIAATGGADLCGGLVATQVLAD